MLIRFRPAWVTPRKTSSAFRQKANESLFLEYKKRISHFGTCEFLGLEQNQLVKPPKSHLWILDRGPGSRVLSSEQVAQNLGDVLQSGLPTLEIWVGGPDGWNSDTLKMLKPELRWSFGPMTLPHELALVVASEQIYRAWAILKGLPYHSGHSA
jgi:23S rRNA pseudoU1915 N3-methylase RlmH